MTTSLSYLIAYVSTHSLVIPVGIAIFRWRYLRGGVLLFAILEAINLCFAIYSTLTFNDGNNSYLEFISLSIDALIMSLIFGPLMPSRKLQRLVLIVGVLFVCGIGADFVWGEGPKQIGANYASSLESVFVSGTIIIYFNSLLQQYSGSLRRYPMAIIGGCLLFINLLCLPIHLFGPALMSYSMTLTLRAFDIMYLSGLLVQIGYGYAFWINSSTGQVIQPISASQVAGPA